MADLDFGDIDIPTVHIDSVMIVDDDPESAEPLKNLFERNGMLAWVVKTGGQIQSVMSRRRVEFAVLKVILPGESGFEICERLKQMEPSLPVLIYSEISLEPARNLAERIGADGYLVRPASDETLLEVMHEIAQIVFVQSRMPADEHGHIRFRCTCGQKFKERYSHRGKFINCRGCNQRLLIPMHSDRIFVTRDTELDRNSGSEPDDPLRLVTVKCQYCSTFYYLFPDELEKARTCPKCEKQQSGSLSIVGAPLSRAALDSSLRVLRIRSGKHKGKKLLLPDQEILLGSGNECGIRFTTNAISEKHCSLTPTPHGILVRDLNTPQGTLINGEVITRATLLKAGELLEVGPLVFQLIGEAQDVNEVASRVEDWQVAEEKALEKGVSVYHRPTSTADEAARVVKLHWELQRRMSQGDNE